jgi:hypothetical protein
MEIEITPRTKVRIICPQWNRLADMCMEPKCPYPIDNPRFERRVSCPKKESSADWGKVVALYDTSKKR